MNGGIFITGTDTGVGKTVVTAGLLRSLRRKKVNAISMKPVQTGAERKNGKLFAPDLDFHLRAACLDPDAEVEPLQTPFLYEPECSPHLAGRLAKNYPDCGEICRCFRELSARFDTVLVEGAGGLLAPLNETQTMLDLAVTLSIPVLLVARRGLGTINHSLLSLGAMREANLDVMGIVFNETEPVEADFVRLDNPGAIEAFGKVVILGNVDFLDCSNPADGDTWERFEDCMPGLDYIIQAVTA